MNRQEEIKKLLSASRNLLNKDMVNESTEILNKYYGIIKESDDDEYETAEPSDEDNEETPKDRKFEKKTTYRISGGLMTINGKDNKELQLTTDDKIAFQSSMDEFVSEVSELVDFNTLNLYPNNVEWSGKIQDLDIEFFFSIGETNGVYINGDMININDEFVEFTTKLRTYYEKFKAKWSKVKKNTKRKMKNFLVKYYKDILLVVLTLLLTIILIKIFKPIEDRSELLKYKLDQLDQNISKVKNLQIQLNDSITSYKKDIEKIDENILKIKSEKTTVNNYYEQKKD